ncbi:hypothetical protein STEG23_014724, partial [Scotinomys teguina]
YLYSCSPILNCLTASLIFQTASYQFPYWSDLMFKRTLLRSKIQTVEFSTLVSGFLLFFLFLLSLYLQFQKTTNDKKQFLRLPASENSIQKVLKTETQGINAMQVADALRDRVKIPGKMKYSPTEAVLLQPPGSRNQESRHILEEPPTTGEEYLNCIIFYFKNKQTSGQFNHFYFYA